MAMYVNKYKISFRYEYGLNKGTIRPIKTICEISDVEDGAITVGISTCSDKDLASRSTGRKIALARALQYGDWTKEQRIEFWNKYFEEHKK